jgi:hypothetical protein
MSKTHRGKIGRLPAGIREELNRRMDDGEKGAALMAWLNSLPEVRAVMAEKFDGEPIIKQNLSQWRKRGFQEWVRWREAKAMMAGEPGMVPGAEASSEPLMDQMTKWASVYYLMTVRDLNRAKEEGAPDAEGKLKMLRTFCRDAIALQRGEYHSGKLKLEQDRFTWRNLKSEAAKSE